MVDDRRGTPLDLVPPQVRARLADLHIGTRQAPGIHGFGLHASRNRGAGLEFAQYRGYEPGDELRQVDWKLYARSDRFFVREAERESPLALWLLLDTSASMGQGDAARPGWTRLDAARALAACVIEVALRQGDRFSVAAAGGDGVQLLPIGTGARQRARCLLMLQGLSASGGWPDEDRLRPLWEHIAPRSLVVALGDGFDQAGLRLAERLAATRRDVVDVQLLTAEERDFPFRGGQRFRDPETGAELLGDGASVRDDFIARFGAARAARSARLAASGVRHAEYVLDEPLDLPLRRLFAGKAGR